MPTYFDVIFSENLGSADGQLKTIKAVATNMNFDTSPGQFLLKFGEVISSHWILALGPIEPGAGMDTNLQYPWAIVSDALGSTLAVLARDMTSFQQYEQSVLDRVKTLGFTTPATKPNKIYQSEMCKYPTMGGPMTGV